MFRSGPVQDPAPRKLLGIIYNEVTKRSLFGQERWAACVGLVRFSNKGHVIPANKAGRIVALRLHFQPIAKGSDDVDPGSFVYL